MVSPLWKASSDGDLQKVLEYLNEPSAVDIELKDHTGATPLIEAVRNGHIEIVKVLLEKGADPSNSSSQGLPENYTSDAAILELLHAAQNKPTPNGVSSPQPGYPNEGQDDPEKRFYAPAPPDSYTYYPTINPSLSTVNEPGAFYPSQPPADSANGMGNLPPPDIARLIPCRYFPACRYGAQCMFAHPQTPYFQPGPMPPVQYPPYDPMGHQYIPQYYPSPPPFQQSPIGHPMSPMSPPPGPPMMHARTPSEVISPAMSHFSPSGPPPPPIPYGPMSPPVYSHPGQVPISMPPISPLPALHPHGPPPPPQAVPQPPANLYNSNSSVPPFSLHQDTPASYPIPVPPSNANYSDATNGVRPENSQLENYNAHPNYREGINNNRRGSTRRPSIGARKPPCLFYPAGRCKNGNECRFQHVLHENRTIPVQSGFPLGRGGAPRSRPHTNGVNGAAHIEAKLNNMSIQDQDTPRQKNGIEGSSRSHSSDAGSRPKFHQGNKHSNPGANNNKKVAAVRQQQQQQQRVPNADEFPILGGSTTPTRIPGSNGIINGHSGPTAAQVLQAPPPIRKDGSKESSTRGTTPDPIRVNTSKDSEQQVNNNHPESSSAVQDQPATSATKVPVMTFAAAATSGTNEISKEVSVSA